MNLNLSKQKIRYVHSNSHESKSNNRKVQGLNVKVYPTDNFLDNWT